MTRIAVAVLALALTLAGCDRPRGRVASGEGRVIDGDVRIARDGRGFRRVRGSFNIRSGDVVRTYAGGAELGAGGGTLELSPDSEVRIGDVPRLERGAALVRDARLRGREATIGVTGMGRVDRGLSLLVAAYEGTFTLSGTGSRVTAQRLRQASVSQGYFPRVSVPIRIDPADRWDRRVLGDELELERAIAGFALSDEQVAAAMASTAGAGVVEVVSLRDEGASWGVVAATLRASPERVLAAITALVATTVPTPGPSPSSSGRRRPTPTGAPPPTTRPPGPTAPPTPTPLCVLVLCV